MPKTAMIRVGLNFSVHGYDLPIQLAD